MKKLRKILALVLITAILLTFLPVVPATAETNAVTAYAENLGAVIGEELINEPFSSGDMSASTANSLDPMTNTATSGWKFISENIVNISYRPDNATNAGKMRISGGKINMWSYGGDAIAVLPDLNTSNYIITATVTGGTSRDGYFGFITDINADIKSATKSKRFGVLCKSDKSIGGAAVQLTTDSSSRTPLTVTGSYSLANSATMTIGVVSYDGKNYYFIGDEFVGTSNKYEADDERIAIYANNTDVYFDNVVVTALSVGVKKTIEEILEEKAVELGATIGENLLSETFNKSTVSGSTATEVSADLTQNAGWQFIANGTNGSLAWNGANTAKYTVNSANGLNFYCSNGDAVLLLPDLDTSNYIITAKIKRGGGNKTDAVAGFMVDVDGDGTTATKAQTFGLIYNANSPFTVANAFFADRYKNYTNYDLTQNLTLGDYVTLSLVSYDGNHYFFVEDACVATMPKLKTDDERIGFVVRTADIWVDDISVTNLVAPVVKTHKEIVEEKALELGATIGDELINEPFNSGNGGADVTGEMTATATPGWKFIKGSKKVSIANSQMNLYDYNSTGIVLLPALNTSNYILSFKFKGAGTTTYNGGIITDTNENATTTAKHFAIKYNSGNVLSTATYGIDTNDSYNSITHDNKYSVEDFIDVSVVSYEGNLYYFIDGDFIMSQEKVLTEGERFGFFAHNGDFYVDDVVVTKLVAPVIKTPEDIAKEYAQELGATFGDELLYEPFDSGNMGSAQTGSTNTVTNTAMPGWSFVSESTKQTYYNSNNPGKFRINNGQVNIYSYGSDAVLVLPDLNTSNYIFSASLKGGVKNNAGIITDIDGDIKTVEKARRFGISLADGNVVTGAFTQFNSNSANRTDLEVTEDHSTSEGLTLTVVSFDGNNYYFIDKEYVGTISKFKASDERIALYIYNTDVYFDEIKVTNLIPPVVRTEDELYAESLGATIGDELLYEPFDGTMDTTYVDGEITSIDVEGTKVTGYKLTNQPGELLWKGNRIGANVNSGRFNMWCYYGDAALVLPDFNTSNYILTAQIKCTGGDASAKLGFMTDIDGDVATAKKGKRFGVALDASQDGDATRPIISAFTQLGSDSQNSKVEYTVENTYSLADYITFTVISFNGTNYYLINGDLITTNQKYDLADERTLIFAQNADAFIDSLKVTKLNCNLDNAITDILGMKAIELGTAEDGQTYKINFNYLATGDFSLGFFTADAETGAGSIGYVEGKDVAIYTSVFTNDSIKNATAFVTANMKGSKDNPVGDKLYLYVVSGNGNVNINNVTLEKITNESGKSVVSNNGVSMLEGLAENDTQALRYYFNYDTVTGKEIIMGGETYNIVSRGILFANGSKMAEEVVSRELAKTNTSGIKDFNITNLTKCWELKVNDSGNYNLTFSNYVTNFEADNNTYNNTKRLYAKAYVVINVDGREYTIYAEESNYTVKEVADMQNYHTAPDTKTLSGVERTLVWSNEFNTDGNLGNLVSHHSNSVDPEFADKLSITSQNLIVADGNLTLRIHNNGDNTYTLPTRATSRNKMSYKYGYLEIKALVPYKKAIWPEFWLSPDESLMTSQYLGEIDVFEVFGSTDTLSTTLHKWDTSGETYITDTIQNEYTFSWLDSLKLDSTYHTYGFEWTETYMRFYVDGKKYYEVDLTNDIFEKHKDNMEAFKQYYHIIFGNGVYDSTLMNNPISGNVDYKIDYVRLYQNAESEFIKLY